MWCPTHLYGCFGLKVDDPTDSHREPTIG